MKITLPPLEFCDVTATLALWEYVVRTTAAVEFCDVKTTLPPLEFCDVTATVALWEFVTRTIAAVEFNTSTMGVL